MDEIKTCSKFGNIQLTLNFLKERKSKVGSISQCKPWNYSDKKAVFAERFKKPLRSFLKKLFFLAGKASWLTEFQSINKKNITSHSSPKMTHAQAFKNTQKRVIFSNLEEKTEEPKPRHELGQLNRTTDNKKVFSKVASTLWLEKLYTIT